jgi:hypothetical protein
VILFAAAVVAVSPGTSDARCKGIGLAQTVYLENGGVKVAKDDPRNTCDNDDGYWFDLFDVLDGDGYCAAINFRDLDPNGNQVWETDVSCTKYGQYHNYFDRNGNSHVDFRLCKVKNGLLSGCFSSYWASWGY